MRRAALGLLVLGALLVPGAGGSATAATLPVGSSCPVAPDPAALPDAAQLKEMNAFLAPLGVRPTGSRAQNV